MYNPRRWYTLTLFWSIFVYISYLNPFLTKIDDTLVSCALFLRDCVILIHPFTHDFLRRFGFYYCMFVF